MVSLRVVLVMLGKLNVTASFAVIYLLGNVISFLLFLLNAIFVISLMRICDFVYFSTRC